MMPQDLAASTLCLHRANNDAQSIENTVKRIIKSESPFAHHTRFYTEFTGSNIHDRERLNRRFLMLFSPFSIFTPSNAIKRQNTSSRAKSVSTCVSTFLNPYLNSIFITTYNKGFHHALV